MMQGLGFPLWYSLGTWHNFSPEKWCELKTKNDLLSGFSIRSLTCWFVWRCSSSKTNEEQASEVSLSEVGSVAAEGLSESPTQLAALPWMRCTTTKLANALWFEISRYILQLLESWPIERQEKGDQKVSAESFTCAKLARLLLPAFFICYYFKPLVCCSYVYTFSSCVCVSTFQL